MKESNKHFFLISFLPAIAYWYLEANYSLKIALIGGACLGIIEITCEKIFTKKVHTISKVNLALILFLGALSFGANEGIWFKLQPFFTGIGMGSYLLYKYSRSESLMFEMMQSMGNDVAPKDLISLMERNLAFFMISYSLFMGIIAYQATTEIWLFFKTAGFYLSFFVFSFLQVIFLRKKMRP